MIKLSGLDKSAPGMQRFLALEMQASWMKSPISMRFPELLHSSQGLHFLDHDRPDMPVLAPMESFPEWQVDSSTGEVSYVAHTQEGVEFSARAVPLEDEVYMEFRVKNGTGQPMGSIGTGMCLMLGHGGDFGEANTLEGIHIWVDGEYMELTESTPSAEEMRRAPWTLILVKGKEHEYTGAREAKLPESWWVIDQLSDYGVISRDSSDGEHMVGIAWFDEPGLIMSNTMIPCLHAGPRTPVDLAPGEEYVWSGKIYLIENNPEDLKKRFLDDRRRYGERV